MKITAVASPNFSRRTRDIPVSCVVLHADASDSAAKSVSWIKSKESKVSYHVLVDRDGTVFRFVETQHRAWHCGASVFEGQSNVNDFSIGLSFANRNDGVEPYTDLQYEVGAVVCSAWMKVYPAITLDRITTHALVATPAGRKNDPRGFDLARFKALVVAEQTNS